MGSHGKDFYKVASGSMKKNEEDVAPIGECDPFGSAGSRTVSRAMPLYVSNTGSVHYWRIESNSRQFSSRDRRNNHFKPRYPDYSSKCLFRIEAIEKVESRFQQHH